MTRDICPSGAFTSLSPAEGFLCGRRTLAAARDAFHSPSAVMKASVCPSLFKRLVGGTRLLWSRKWLTPSSCESARLSCAIVPFFKCLQAFLDGWTEYKLARQFPNLLFTVFVHSQKDTLKNSHSLTRTSLRFANLTLIRSLACRSSRLSVSERVSQFRRVKLFATCTIIYLPHQKASHFPYPSLLQVTLSFVTPL